MNQEQSIALWRQGKEAWNAWANAMLQRQEGLKRSGLWKTTSAYPFELEQGDSDEAKNWFDEARVDFKGVIFDPPDAKLQINFEGFIFPGAVSFAHASFRGNSWFWHAEFRHIALFEQAEFSGIASFAGAVFHNIASFCGALFNEGTFTRVRFLRRSEFTITRFAGQVDFRAAQFGGDAWFNGSEFSGLALFDDAQFLGAAHFDEGAQFKANARFLQVSFGGYTSFHAAHFERAADFVAVRVERAMSLTSAKFAIMPNFAQADFKQAPDLDNIDFPLPSRLPWKKGNKDLVASYRHIRRLAIQGLDYEREQMALKGELRSKRWSREWGVRAILGLLYDGFADCGRSIWQPFAIWLGSMFAFAYLHLRMAIDSGDAWRDCLSGGGNPAYQAFFLSGKNAFVLFSSGRDARTAQAYKCLFGDADKIPYDVSRVEMFFQTPISAMLIFLFLLAVRNQFKIK